MSWQLATFAGLALVLVGGFWWYERARPSARVVALVAARLASRVVLLGDGQLIADGPADEILSGGWYFATEVARILGGGGAITPEQGAVQLTKALAGGSDEVAVYPPTTCLP